MTSDLVAPMHEILIVGGGFAGVWAALGAATARDDLRHGGLHITLVTREPYLTIRPRLYEATLDDVRVPLGTLLGDAGVELDLGDVTSIDAASRTVTITSGDLRRTRSYDRLILTAGSRLRRPSVPGAEHTFTVDTYAEATALERHLSSLGNRAPSDGRFTAVIVGAGLAGLEVATTMVSRLRSLSAQTKRERPNVVLVERSDRVAPDLGDDPRAHVETALAELGVSLRLGSGITRIDLEAVTLATGERIPAATTVWTGGLAASELTAQLPAERDTLGRIVVDAYLRPHGVDGMFVAGDAAHALADRDHVAPMSCQFAMPMGDRAGRNAVAELVGRAPKRFAPPPYVTCIDLGEWGGLFTQGWDRQVHLSGFWGKVMKESINTRLIVPTAVRRGGELSAARSGETRSAA
jgi:NADH dehydrogenase